MIPEYTLTANELTPAIVSLGKYSTPVWIQQNWQEGEYAVYIRNNGCGHCCTAMALNLFGVKITPYEEFVHCRKLWGEPRKDDEHKEDNFMSISGIVKVLSSFGVKAQNFGVPAGKTDEEKARIREALDDGKLVIICSFPGPKLPDNPFSPGAHYVLAVGFDENGRILVANSSSRSAAENGIQFTDIDTLVNALKEGCVPPDDITWGRNIVSTQGGYVIVG